MWRKVFQTEEIVNAKALRMDHIRCSPAKTRSLWLERGEQGFQKGVHEVREIRQAVDHREPSKSFVFGFCHKNAAIKSNHKTQWSGSISSSAAPESIVRLRSDDLGQAGLISPGGAH